MPTNLDQTEFLAKTDIFSLLDMDNLTPEDKLKFIEKMQVILLRDFFGHDVPELLSEEGANELEKLYEEQASTTDMINSLRDKIPDIEDKLYEKSLDFKKKFVTAQMQQRLDILKKKLELISQGKYPQDKIPEGNINQETLKIKKKIARLEMVVHHYTQGEWVEGTTILQLQNQTN